MKLQHQLIIANTTVAVIFIFIIGLSYNMISQMNETSKWVSHTHKVIGDINHIQKLVIDMETGERGFIVTGDEIWTSQFVKQ